MLRGARLLLLTLGTLASASRSHHGLAAGINFSELLQFPTLHWTRLQSGFPGPRTCSLQAWQSCGGSSYKLRLVARACGVQQHMAQHQVCNGETTHAGKRHGCSLQALRWSPSLCCCQRKNSLPLRTFMHHGHRSWS